MKRTLPEFDFVVVGAGSAGCVLAARLSEDPAASVCPLEAGPRDSHPLIRVPMGMLWLMRSPRLNWRYRTVAQRALAGRTLYCPRCRPATAPTPIPTAPSRKAWSCTSSPG